MIAAHITRAPTATNAPGTTERVRSDESSLRKRLPLASNAPAPTQYAVVLQPTAVKASPNAAAGRPAFIHPVSTKNVRSVNICVRSALYGDIWGRSLTAGPWITVPSIPNLDPWHGQSQLLSAPFHCT